MHNYNQDTIPNTPIVGLRDKLNNCSMDELSRIAELRILPMDEVIRTVELRQRHNSTTLVHYFTLVLWCIMAFFAGFLVGGVTLVLLLTR